MWGLASLANKTYIPNIIVNIMYGNVGCSDVLGCSYTGLDQRVLEGRSDKKGLNKMLDLG